ncbi:MAG TPA: HIT family protein [Chitinophagales bacterium]|jgi:histidine triad (HIT) family protein|nr:HIT family protein [Chitinophagales bacterium]MBP6154580.1 HIT family protein [Chitinophagales bacterium]HQV76909.1 HIT family protein [Chitinophagales bacterium]HQW78024.1 HIT family protein [Chitinophagales bacterium]HRB19266.1 HIT family protein [Chitinophagales bacterium]
MTLFSKIINGDIPCYMIAEDEQHFAFLDIRPLNAGHTLVIPKTEIDYIFDLEDEALKNLIVFAKKIAIALKKTIPCERIGIAVIGLEVPHTHIHLSPINSIHDLDFRNTKSFTNEQMQEIADSIKANL